MAKRRVWDLKNSYWMRNAVSMTPVVGMREGISRRTDGFNEHDRVFRAAAEADPYVQLQIAEVDRLRRRIFKDRLREVPARARQCVMLKLDGKSQKEIGEQLGILENTVEVHLSKAYAILYGPENQKWDKRARRDSYFPDAVVA
jgi:RNA polymerase sigma factor (sigma-70 family)